MYCFFNGLVICNLGYLSLDKLNFMLPQFELVLSFLVFRSFLLL